jgi:sugar O-acyltransferase (sialic acid O-acetyltransferase NeuD family)
MPLSDDAAWVVYACRTPYAAEVTEIIRRRGERVAYLVDNLPGAEAAPPDVRTVDQLGRDVADAPVVVPLLTPGHRHLVVGEARARGFARFPCLVDPTSVLASTTTVGEGSTVNAGVVIGAHTSVRRFVHVNRSASLGHDGVLHDLCTIGPGCVLSGSVTVGPGAFLGAGAVVVPGVVIGANAVVGAGAVVVRDVEDGAVVVGNPATTTRGTGGYGGVSVPIT